MAATSCTYVLIAIFYITTFKSTCAVPNFSSGRVVGRISSSLVTEASGCAASRKHPGMLYIHNDHGDAPRIFGVDSNTAIVLAIYNIRGAHHNDWEDIAVGPCDWGDERSCIYISDGGYSLDHAMYKNTVYRVVEPEALDVTDLDVDSTLRYNWTAKSAGTLMVDEEANVYIIAESQGLHSMIVQLPSAAWGSPNPVYVESNSLFGASSHSKKGPLGGDISPDGKEILVKDYHHIYYFSRNPGEDILSLLSHEGQQVPYIQESDWGEAVCWSADKQYYYTVAEGHHQRLFEYKRLD